VVTKMPLLLLAAGTVQTTCVEHLALPPSATGIMSITVAFPPQKSVLGQAAAIFVLWADATTQYLSLVDGAPNELWRQDLGMKDVRLPPSLGPLHHMRRRTRTHT